MTTLLGAELIKMRRSAPGRLALAAPALLFGLQLLALFGRRTINATDPSRIWADLLTFGWILWLGLFAPALIAFLAISLAGIEHAGRHWKQLFALPVPRWRIFAVKMLVCALLVGASFLVFAATSLAAVLLFSAARGLRLAASAPWIETFATLVRTYAACWLLIVVHLWLSVRFPGFAVPAGIAFAAVLIGTLLLNVNPDSFGWWYPWSLPLAARPDGLYAGRHTLAPAVFGGIAGLVLAPLASWDLGRRAEHC
jgi:ABC-2 type transport system permease protein